MRKRLSVTDILLTSMLNMFKKSPAACMLENLVFYPQTEMKVPAQKNKKKGLS